MQNPMEIIRSAPALFGASVRRLFGASSVRRKRSAPFGARPLFGACSALEPIYRHQEPNNTAAVLGLAPLVL